MGIAGEGVQPGLRRSRRRSESALGPSSASAASLRRDDLDEAGTERSAT
jgi:hypothetical protein